VSASSFDRCGGGFYVGTNVRSSSATAALDSRRVAASVPHRRAVGCEVLRIPRHGQREHGAEGRSADDLHRGELAAPRADVNADFYVYAVRALAREVNVPDSYVTA